MTQESNDRASWPYGTLLLCGTFRLDTPGGKRYLRRTTGAFVMIAVGMFMSGAPIMALRVAAGLVGTGGVAVIAWAFAQYIRELDELSRRIQLEALAIAYACVIVLAAAWFFYATINELTVTVNPRLTMLWLIAAEPIRGIALAYIAKRYE